jgi:hypothetical protein
VIGGAIFILFVPAEVQWWNDPKVKIERDTCTATVEQGQAVEKAEKCIEPA